MAAQTYQLTMRSGPNPGRTFPIEQEEVLLGRDLANDIAIGDPEVSRRHARLIWRDDNILLEDLGSTNGTFLNGERISSPKQLRAGDVITFGENVVMVFEKTSYDPDATIVSPRGAEPAQPAQVTPPPKYQEVQEPQYYQQAPEPSTYEQPEPQPPVSRPVKEKKGGLPTWLIILIIAIVVLACVITVTLYFMPASWWCAITFDMLEGCPLP
jgi:predicted component of type VI protein secretion system